MPTRRDLLTLACAAAPALCGASAAARRRLRHHATKLVAEVPPSSPAATPIGPVDTQAQWAFIMDASTGTMLLQKNADVRMPPSSLTKMMTAYVVFSALAMGRLKLDQTLPVSEKAWRMQGSKMFVPLGQQVSVENLIQGMVIQSGNDACIVLAEGLAGSEAQFVDLMNQQAQRMGLAQTHFANATGWPAPDHYMSARDVAILAQRVIKNFPQYYHFFDEKDYKFNNIDQANRNVLVDRGLADGLKTGHTDAGGFGLCASSERGGMRIIAVLNGMPSSRARVEEGERLMGWAFANFEEVHLFAKGRTVRSVPVWLGVKPAVAAVVDGDVMLTLAHGWRRGVKVSAEFQTPVAAPVKAGQRIGTLVVSGVGARDLSIPLVAGQAVARLALPGRAVAVLEHAIGGG